MHINSHSVEIHTKGHNHVIDITARIVQILDADPCRQGIVHLFVTGSTAGITTTEFEPGLVEEDLAAGFERIAPEHERYRHEETWHDDNGHSHVRASLLGPSLSIPIVDGSLPLGTWQQIVLIDFDTRPRQRMITVQIIGQ